MALDCGLFTNSCCRAAIERSRAYAVYARSSNNCVRSLRKPGDRRRPDPEKAFVTTTSSTSELERRVFANRKLPVRSSRPYNDSESGDRVIPPGTVCRRSPPVLLPMDPQNHVVPHESPRAEERSADRPCSESSGPALAAKPLGSPSDAVLEMDGPGTNDVNAAKPDMIADGNSACEMGGERPKLASFETAFKRSSSLRPSSNENRKRRRTSPDANDNDGVGKVFVRRRAASFNINRSSRNPNDVSHGQRHWRRMSAFSLPRPLDDLRTQTASTTSGVPTVEMSRTRDTRGRVDVDERPSLPPRHRPASGNSDGRQRRLRRPDDVAVWATPVVTGTRTTGPSATSDVPQKRRRRSGEQINSDDKPRMTENSGHRRDDRHHRQRRRRHHGNSGDDDDGRNDDREVDHSRHRHYRHRRRSTSERRRPSSDGEYRAADSTSYLALDDDSHRLSSSEC